MNVSVIRTDALESISGSTACKWREL